MDVKKKVLIIDDDKMVSAGLQDVLESEGYEVTCCNDGMTAIDLAKGKSFQIIISDYNMPGMNGAEVVGILRWNLAHSFIHYWLQRRDERRRFSRSRGGCFCEEAL